MEVMYSKLWTAFSASLRALVVLVCGTVGVVIGYAETLTGFVYSNELGNGVHPAGRFDLAVGNKIYTVDYGEPLNRHFQSDVCNDIGAEWSVVAVDIDNGRYAKQVTCSGRTNEDIHKPWLLVRGYMEALPGSLAGNALSDRYRNSPEFRSFAQQISSHDLSFYYGQGEAGKCLKVVSVDPGRQTHLSAHCAIELRDRPVVLFFDVVKNHDNGAWQIDEIRVE